MCVVALFVGVIPAWRGSAPLTRHARDHAGVGPRQRSRAVFVVAELALALTLHRRPNQPRWMFAFSCVRTLGEA